MNLGNKLAVGVAVDPGCDSGISREIDSGIHPVSEVATPEVAVREPALPVPAATVDAAHEVPVAARAEH